MKTQEVAKPVYQPCLEPELVTPVPPTSMPPKEAGIEALAAGAAADALRYREYAERAEGLLRACSMLK